MTRHQQHRTTRVTTQHHHRRRELLVPKRTKSRWCRRRRLRWRSSGGGRASRRRRGSGSATWTPTTSSRRRRTRAYRRRVSSATTRPNDATRPPSSSGRRTSSAGVPDMRLGDRYPGGCDDRERTPSDHPKTDNSGHPHDQAAARSRAKGDLGEPPCLVPLPDRGGATPSPPPRMARTVVRWGVLLSAAAPRSRWGSRNEASSASSWRCRPSTPGSSARSRSNRAMRSSRSRTFFAVSPSVTSMAAYLRSSCRCTATSCSSRCSTLRAWSAPLFFL
mmetsp:Transcript_1315/g.5069  ORF Transcript_1315/g.5069 Transcript_1315/m.5069 type:complete len:276 (+) Transcript_1315:664-1491(+)